MVAKFVCSESRDFYSVTLCVRCADGASANVTDSDSIDGPACRPRREIDICMISWFMSCFPYRRRRWRRDFVLFRGSPAVSSDMDFIPRRILASRRRPFVVKTFSGHVIREECRPFSRVSNRLIRFGASRITATRIIRRCFKGMRYGAGGKHM